VIAFLILAAAPLQCPDRVGNQWVINECARRDLRKAESKLDAQWAVTLKAAAEQDSTDNSYSVDTLKASQQSWRAYRDAQCRVEAAPVGYMGTLDEYLYISCQTSMTEKRIDDLRDIKKAYDQ
jgi:uncharacterized protein YecT (DUF1311 family)